MIHDMGLREADHYADAAEVHADQAVLAENRLGGPVHATLALAYATLAHAAVLREAQPPNRRGPSAPR